MACSIWIHGAAARRRTAERRPAFYLRRDFGVDWSGAAWRVQHWIHETRQLATADPNGGARSACACARRLRADGSSDCVASPMYTRDPPATWRTAERRLRRTLAFGSSVRTGRRRIKWREKMDLKHADDDPNGVPICVLLANPPAVDLKARQVEQLRRVFHPSSTSRRLSMTQRRSAMHRAVGLPRGRVTLEPATRPSDTGPRCQDNEAFGRRGACSLRNGRRGLPLGRNGSCGRPRARSPERAVSPP